MTNRAPRYVLDSYALLVYLQREQSAERVRGFLRAAQRGQASLSLCMVNLAEVLYLLERRRGSEAARDALVVLQQELPIQMAPADLLLSLNAAHLKASYPIALADCYVAALAQQLGATVLTGDPDFARLENVVSIEWL